MAERAFVALDLETTGLNHERDAITEVAAVRVQGDRITERFSTLVNPQRPIPLAIQQMTGIRNEDVAGAPPIAEVLPELLAFVDSSVAAVIAHNARFDLGFLRAAGLQFHRPALDTFELASILLPGMASYSLGELCRAMGITLDGAHRALHDTEATAQLFIELNARLRRVPANVLEVVVAAGQESRWAPLLIFEDALRERGGSVGPLPRTDLARCLQTSIGGPALGAGASPSLVDSGGPPVTPIDLDRMERLFAGDGDLAGSMGDQYERRIGQADMARHVLDALNQGDHLIIEAGTGVGKSLGYLAPAAFWSRQNERRVVIATNTIALQDQLVEKEIPQVQALIKAAGLPPLRTALLKGRQNYLCTRRLQEWVTRRRLSPHELSVLARILVWLPTTVTGDVGEIFLPSKADKAVWRQICSDGMTCSPSRCGARTGVRDFYLDARRQADHAHLLVVNHALLTADLAADGRVLPDYEHLIVDEAHRLEEATTDQFTYAVDWETLRRMLAQLSLEGDLAGQILGLATRGGLDRLQDRMVELATSARHAVSALQHFAGRLQQFARHHEATRSDAGYAQRLPLDARMRTQPEWSEIEIEWDGSSAQLRHVTDGLGAIIELLKSLQWEETEPESRYLAQLTGLRVELSHSVDQLDLIVLQTPSSAVRNIIAWLEYTDNRRSDSESEARLVAAPLYVGNMLQESLVHRCRSTVFTGATLRSGPDFRYIRERLGLWDAAAISIPSPYDFERNALLLMPRDLPSPNQKLYQQAVEQAIVDAAVQAGGRTMALFTSYAQLRATAASIRAPLDQMDITLLQHGVSSRNRLLREYRRAERAVLLGTRTFWEGIDLPGEQLSVLIIVRLPFAVPSDPLVAARSNEFDNPFREYMLPETILRFRQGFGRLIRRSTDRGVVILLDSRVWQKSYGQSFLDALPTCTVHRAPFANLGAEIDLWLNE